MKKHRNLILVITLLLAAVLGSSSALAQGTVLLVTPSIQGTQGLNGWYISDVIAGFIVDPSWTIVDGCGTTVINQDTSVEGFPITCLIIDGLGGSGGGTFYIKRDATPPEVQPISPAQTQVSADEGSTLVLQALAQDANLVSSGWDLDHNGTIDAPNPTSITVPGVQGGLNPCFIAEDAAGNRGQLDVQISSINLPPFIDGWVVASMIHFGGTLDISATASDPGNDPLTASVDWGDGLSEPVVVKPDGSLQAAHVYASDGSFAVTLSVSDSDGAVTGDRRTLMVESPVQTIEGDLIPGTLGLVGQGILNQGQADSLVVKLEGTVDALNNDRPAAPQKLDAYLNEFAAVVPNAAVSPCWIVATDVRNALNGLVAPPN